MRGNLGGSRASVAVPARGHYPDHALDGVRVAGPNHSPGIVADASGAITVQPRRP